ncbi:sigma-70 family RNA polymerase sigma factor [Streptomyces sp. NPDC096153]|uniref:RNA polymerase sigma factor n=1 Tax=Streptomyces sp. NPDC096153 TaxID=3155548 RepID=UPI0033267132
MPIYSKNESSIATRFSQGDETALIEIYDRYSGPMFATAYSLVGNRELAAEAVQQAFVQAWQAAHRFDASRELQPWLYAITRRTAIDTYRRSRRSSALIPLEIVSDSASVEPPGMERAWQNWEVRKALERLTPDEREVMRLAHFAGMSQSEISKHLSVPLGTVKSRTARAQRRLTKMLTHLMEEIPVDSAQ